jgi:PHS family inorganic phosphate transporter-like MFS transporter
MPAESFELTHKDDDVPHDLNERRRKALQEIDDATFSWFHVKVAAVAGAGFLTDA